MKCFAIIAAAACLVAVASASRLYGAAPISTGSSSQFRSEDNYGNYAFGYDEAHATGATSRREEQTNGIRRGSYSLSDADGRRRTVNYVADAAGFRANIETNEPGVEPKDPADVLINKAAAQVVAAPAPVYAAPAPVLAAPAPVYAAPAAVKGYVAPAPVKAAYAAPVAAAPVAYGPAVVEAPTPRAFSYSFGSTHASPIVAAPAYAPVAASIAAPAPVYQQRLEY